MSARLILWNPIPQFILRLLLALHIRFNYIAARRHKSYTTALKMSSHFSFRLVYLVSVSPYLPFLCTTSLPIVMHVILQNTESTHHSLGLETIILARTGLTKLKLSKCYWKWKWLDCSNIDSQTMAFDRMFVISIERFTNRSTIFIPPSQTACLGFSSRLVLSPPLIFFSPHRPNSSESILRNSFWIIAPFCRCCFFRSLLFWALHIIICTINCK